MTLTKRIKNLIELSRFTPKPDGSLIQEVERPKTEKRMAKIVPMDNPIVDHFKEEA